MNIAPPGNAGRLLTGFALSCLTSVCLFFSFESIAFTQTTQANQKKGPGEKMTIRASGTFEVKLAPQDDTAVGSTFGRMLIDKQFHGDLTGTSKGQMLAAMTSVKDSAGYVAVELVTGTLHGRKGSFVLQHSGTMNRGEPRQSVTVVPDSGTGELAGLVGQMTIKIADGKHFYEFEYTLTKTP